MPAIAKKICVVTGAGGGLGRALAKAFAAAGAARIYLVDSDQGALSQTVDVIRAAGSGTELEAALVDVARSEAVDAFAAAVIDKSGPPDLVVNNAGVVLTATLERMSLADFEWLMGVNFWGVVYGCHAFAPAMAAAGRGHIVNLSSIHGCIGVPGISAYSASKFAVRGFSEAIGFELAPKGVTVSVVLPGCIHTNIARNARFRGLDDPSITQAMIADRFDRLPGLTPDEAARRICAGITAGKRRIIIGRDAYAVDAIQRLLPAGWERVILPSFLVIAHVGKWMKGQQQGER